MQNNELLLKKLRLDAGASETQVRFAYEKLKNSYELIAISTEDEGIKAAAERKLEELKRLGEALPCEMEIELVAEEEYDEVINAAYRMLGNSRANEGDIQIMIGKLGKIGQTGESYYLQGLLHLQINNGYPGCERAKQPIENAVTMDPNNQAYLALKEGVDSVIRAKIAHDEEMQREKERQLEIERQRQLEAQRRARIQMFWSVCQTVCTVVFGIICGVFQCVCTCCDN